MPARARSAAGDPGAAPAAPAPFSGEMEGTDDDGNPVGLLMWGQAGIYNGVDDRRVITAVIDNAVGGVVRPPSLSAGPGLAVNVGAGWIAVASCGDGTNAVIGAAQTHVVHETAGPASGTRRDLLWADTDPDAGTWTLRVIREDEMPGRAGLPLARITVPAGANLASQMTLSGDVHFLSPKVDSDPRNCHGATAWTDLTPRYPFTTYGIRRDALFRLTAYGNVDVGHGTEIIRFRAGGAVLGFKPELIGGGMNARLHNWAVTAETVFGHQYADGVGNTRLSLTVTRTDWDTRPEYTVHGVAYAGSVSFGAGPWLWMGLETSFNTAMPNANVACQSSAFEQVGKPW